MPLLIWEKYGIWLSYLGIFLGLARLFGEKETFG
jgi:hypothetical protein